jgi:aspartate aminotransferase-like enzyme
MKRYLMTPGPTTIPERVLVKQAEQIIHHRTSEYREILGEVLKGLKYVFQTQNDVIILTSSGTGAMEAAVVNLMRKGDKALVVVGGKFGERFEKLCEIYGVEVIKLAVPWGEAVSAYEIQKILETDKDISAVFVTLCETSTGVVNDLSTIGRLVKETGAVLVVDAISALGSVEIRTDEWAVDMVIAGSQKGLMLPPGLAFISISEKAWEKIKKNVKDNASLPSFYFNLSKAKEALLKTDHPFTPAVTLVVALRESLAMIKEEGLERVLARHRRLAEAMRAGIKALGLELFSKSPSDSITAINVPADIDGLALVKKLSDEYGITVAGGQDELKGKIFRIAHMGYADRFDVIAAISALEMCLVKMGADIKLGAGIKAAEEVLNR